MEFIASIAMQDDFTNDHISEIQSYIVDLTEEEIEKKILMMQDIERSIKEIFPLSRTKIEKNNVGGILRLNMIIAHDEEFPNHEEI